MRIISTKRNNNFFIKTFKILLILAILLIILFYFLKKFIYPIKYFDIIEEEAKKNNVDPYLVLSIIKVESGFNEYAVSNKDAKGLMQIMDSTAAQVNEYTNSTEDIDSEIFIPDVNISIGCKYFSNLIKKYNGNYYVAICAYNAGLGNVDSWINKGTIPKDLDRYKNVEEIPFNQTKKYLEKVVSTYKMYKLLYK